MSDLGSSVRFSMFVALAGIGIAATTSGCAQEQPEQPAVEEEVFETADGELRRRRTMQLLAKLSMTNEACRAAWPGETEPGGDTIFRFVRTYNERGRVVSAALVTLNDLKLMPNMEVKFTAGDIRKGTPGDEASADPPFLKGEAAEMEEGSTADPWAFKADANGEGRKGFGYVVMDYSLAVMAQECVRDPGQCYIDLRTEDCPDGFLSGAFAYPTGG